MKILNYCHIWKEINFCAAQTSFYPDWSSQVVGTSFVSLIGESSQAVMRKLFVLLSCAHLN